MKRSKIYLGVTTCLLAIVGVAAARAHKFSAQHHGFYGTQKSGGTNGTCLHLSAVFSTQGSTPAVTKTGANYPVYTKSNTSGCTQSISNSRLYSNNVGD